MEKSRLFDVSSKYDDCPSILALSVHAVTAVKHKKKTHMSWPIKERSSFTSVLFIHFELIQELVKAKLVIP